MFNPGDLVRRTNPDMNEPDCGMFAGRLYTVVDVRGPGLTVADSTGYVLSQGPDMPYVWMQKYFERASAEIPVDSTPKVRQTGSIEVRFYE